LNVSGVAGDANNGSISWTQRLPWSAEDDHNFHRTDRSLIKGVAYDAAIPTYLQSTDQSTPVPANLINIAGKTTDAKEFIRNKKDTAFTANSGNLFETFTDVGNVKHADAVDVTGIPVFDGFDAGDDEATYVEVVDNADGNGLVVLAGGNAGERIFARTRVGSSTSPNSVEIEWRSVAFSSPLSASNAYTWEVGQPTSVDIFYPYRNSLDGLDENAFRVTLTSGLIADAGLSQEIDDVRAVIGVGAGDTDLSAQLTNTGTFFVFNDLPDITPSVVEALNTLNEQVGIRDYTGAILTDGDTITQSLQDLSDSIGSSSAITRTIERLVAPISAGTAHTLPGGLTYTLDGADNGNNLWVYWRKQLRDPGAVSGGNDYEETSTTQITPYSKVKNGDHMNYFTSA